MTTLREQLKAAGFEFSDDAEILWQPVSGDSRCPGWAHELKQAIIIDNNHKILDHEFRDGFGGPECPRFVAKEKNYLYFPAQYDGSTWVERIDTTFADYLNGEGTPYPGG
jgi:hypothetical protein